MYLFVTLWTIARQAPLPMGFSKQEYWNWLPCPPSGDLLNLRIEPASLESPALAGGFFTISATWEAWAMVKRININFFGKPLECFEQERCIIWFSNWSVAKLYLTLRDPMNCNTPGFPLLHYLMEFAQLISTELVMPFNHLILCRPLRLLSSIFSSIRVFVKP